MKSSLTDLSTQETKFKNYPSVFLSNENIKMRVYLPDKEAGIYRATRFDWSGIIGFLQYKGHDYFSYWKETHNPMVHEDLMGPAEGFINPGLGYKEAKTGDGFIRIGVGIIEKEKETEYDWMKTYNILDFGKWIIEHSKSQISFTHILNSDFGYSYEYQKIIKLNDNGFQIEHTLKNTGKKLIETDQFNHNFFRINSENSGPAFDIEFPFQISALNDYEKNISIDDNKIKFLKELDKDSAFLLISGFSKKIKDNKVKVVNKKTGAGLVFSINKPLDSVVFWAIKTTLCPENAIFISVKPGEKEKWISEYRMFVDS